MNRLSSRNARAAALQVAILALLVVSAPAVAQSSVSTPTASTANATSTDEQVKAANQRLLNADKFQNPYNGMGDPIPVRKDAWTWYWNEKAHIDIDPEDKARFWGDDAVSNLFKNIANNCVIPFWNGAMEYDFIRAGFLLILAGMLLGTGASIVNPKKTETK